MAVNNDNIGSVRVLLELGAATSEGSSGTGPIERARKLNNPEMIRLLEQHADPYRV